MATQSLLQKQLANDPKCKPLKLIQDVSTRWNSSYMMVKRLLNLRVPVFAVLHDESVTKASDRAILDMTDNNWKVLESILPVLEPFVDATEILGKEDSPTGSQVFVLLGSLFQTLNDSELDNGVCKDLKSKIKLGLMKRFHVDASGTPNDSVVESSPLVLALALDPRYKSLKTLTARQREIVKGRIAVLLDDEVKNSTEGDANTEAKEEEPKPKVAKVTDCLIGDITFDLTSIESNSDEYSEFIKETIRIPNPLNWWELSETRYPKLAILAKRYLCIPATSIPSERVFSVAGQTVSKLRASLDKDTVNEILFLHKHLKKTICNLLEDFPQTNEPQAAESAGESAEFEIKREINPEEMDDLMLKKNENVMHLTI